MLLLLGVLSPVKWVKAVSRRFPQDAFTIPGRLAMRSLSVSIAVVVLQLAARVIAITALLADLLAHVPANGE